MKQRARAVAQRSKTDEQLVRARRREPLARPPVTLALAGNRAISRRVAGGLPFGLRANIEEMAGVSLAGVRVHEGSNEPARHDAHAFTHGADIHLAPGREADLPHEAWHVAQQRQGRVEPTGESNGLPLNHDPGFETEAERMGEAAFSRPASSRELLPVGAGAGSAKAAVQLKCKICGAGSHNANKCPKNPEKKEDEKKKGRGLTAAGKREKELFAAILPKLDRLDMFGDGAKSLVGGYKGKPNGLRDNSVRIDRQGLGNVQFQIGDDSYACAEFEQDAKPGAIIAALFRSLDSGQNEAA